MLDMFGGIQGAALYGGGGALAAKYLFQKNWMIGAAVGLAVAWYIQNKYSATSTSS